MNLMIVVAVIAVVVLVAQYISQLRNGRNGSYYVSGGRVFLNWLLAIVLVVCLVGIGYESFYGNKEEAQPQQSEKTENVKYTSSDDLEKVSLQFNKNVKMDDNGEANVKFTISPKTKLTIRGHNTKEVVKVFKAGKATAHTYTFDVAGTYDIIAQRGTQKITKKLNVESNESSSSSVVESSSSVSVSSSSSSSSAVSSSASVTSQSTSSRASSNGTQTASNTSRSYVPRHSRPNSTPQSGVTTSTNNSESQPVAENAGETTPESN